MLIKVIPFRAVDSQRPSGLASKIRYLLADRFGTDSEDIFKRLAGPVITNRIVQRVMPYGSTFRLAASDIAQQFFDHIRLGCFDRDVPHQVYTHLVISFAPAYRRKQARIRNIKNIEKPTESTYSRSLRIIMDVLYELGVNERSPLYIAIHDDRRHLHAHVIIALYAAGIPDCNLYEINSSKIRSVAKKIDAKYELSRTTTSLKLKHSEAASIYDIRNKHEDEDGF